MTVRPRTAPPRAAIVLATLVLAALAAGPGAGPALAQRDTSQDPITVKAEPVTIAPGGTAEARVIITLEPGYRIVGDPPPTKWVTPASFAVESSGGIIAKPAQLPPSKLHVDEDGGVKYAIWEGTMEIRIPLQASIHAPKGAVSLHGRLRYQLSLNNDFFSVAVRKVDIPVKVAAAGKDGAPQGAPKDGAGGGR